LARALGNLGIRLASLQQWGDASAATTEAIDLFRRLAVDRLAAVGPDFAQVLSWYGADLWDQGRHEESAAVAAEAAAVRRRLAPGDDQTE
jgi:hypothetical protein